MVRREKRRLDARYQLGSAFEALASMGAGAFAERARREFQASEKVRKRSEDSRTDLTPQEEEIAQLAREGQTNTEIGAQLFIGRHTWRGTCARCSPSWTSAPASSSTRP